jgi:hypothetical protein
MAKSKVCAHCGKRRPLDWYGADERYADGLRPHCARCRIEYTEAWREANRDAFNETKRAYESRPDVKVRRRERDRARAARLRREGA